MADALETWKEHILVADKELDINQVNRYWKQNASQAIMVIFLDISYVVIMPESMIASKIETMADIQMLSDVCINARGLVDHLKKENSNDLH